jgi:3-dehydroquinate synthase
VNAHGVKSALGCFDPPEAVLSDPGWLTTLPRRALRSGFAEIIKIAAVRDADLLDLVLGHGPELVASGFAEPAAVVEPMLGRSIDLMLDELRDNPNEECLERVVDFGHTFSPALEIASRHQLTHGEAVAIDIALSGSIARRLGLLSETDADAVLAALRSVGLPTRSPLVTTQLLAAAADEAVAHRGGALNLVLLGGVGRPTFLRRREDLPDSLLRSIVSDLDAAEPVDGTALSAAGACPTADGAVGAA